MSPGEIEYLAKARRLLTQALALSPQDVPETVIHLCYYAMFHAATTVLLRHRSAAPLTHTGLIGAFGRLAKDLGETEREHGRALNRAEDLRLRADYGVAYDDLPAFAADLLIDAQSFLSFCEPLLQP